MSFASPLALLALAVVPLTVVALLFAQRRRVRYAVRYYEVFSANQLADLRVC